MPSADGAAGLQPGQPLEHGEAMRAPKRVRERHRQRKLEQLGIQARIARAGTPVRIWTSYSLIHRGIPVGAPSYKWGYADGRTIPRYPVFRLPLVHRPV